MSTIETAPEPAQAATPAKRQFEVRDLLAFGTGVGVTAGATALEVVVARVLPAGVRVVAAGSIERFRERPAAEWGGQYAEILAGAGVSHVAATVILPRGEVIVRQIALPGVAVRDIPAAIGFQIDSLHPFGDEEIAHAWMRLGSTGGVLVGIVRRAVLDRYIDLFTEAGVAAASFTFSAAAMWPASRILRKPASSGCLAAGECGTDGFELYGESPSRPVFSAVFDEAPARALALAAAELRLEPETVPATFADLLAKPATQPPDFDLSRNALAYGAALAGACPRLAPVANLLPPERRVATSRLRYVPTAVLAALLILASAVMLGYSHFRDRAYLKELEAEIAKLEGPGRHAQSLETENARLRERCRLLDTFRGRTRRDLDALNELTHLLAPPAWISALDMNADTVQLAGEAEQAAALVQMFDDSPFFQNAQFVTPIARANNTDLFRLRLERERRP